MGLFDPIWEINNRKIAAAAVKMIKNEDKLYEIATTASHYKIAELAVERIHDEHLLARVLLSAEYPNVIMAAIEKISNQQILREIAMSPAWKPLYDEAEEVIRKITDEQMLYEIAMSPSVKKDIVRMHALSKIKDQTVLADIAFHGPYHTACQAAGRIEDPDLKFKLAMSDADSASRCVSGTLSDPDQLRKIALGSLSKEARLEAVKTIRDIDTLLDVLTQEKVLAIRKHAYSTLQNDCISYKKMIPTDEQRKRLADLLINEPERTDVFIYRDSFAGHPDVLKRIFREAKRKDLRAQAFACICYEAPVEQLPELYKDAGIYNAKGAILGRLSENENNDPAMLMSFIKDFEAEYEKDYKCTGLLFKPQLNDTEGIEEKRDEAVAAFLERIPVYEEKSGGKTDKKVCLRELIKYLTPEQEKKYGIEVSGYEHENEDEFGRYTSRTTVIRFEGKSYYY